jgi:fatty-acyl-CoA synthase
VTVLDALPVTDIGKPYKLALRADAARRETLAALTKVAGIRGVEAAVEDGSLVTIVEILPSADESTVTATLNRYAIDWRVVVTS